jgi:hypothetical protein
LIAASKYWDLMSTDLCNSAGQKEFNYYLTQAGMDKPEMMIDSRSRQRKMTETTDVSI